MNEVIHIDELPGSTRRKIWREWAIGRLRREHSESWWSFMEGIKKKVAFANWDHLIAHDREMRERGERPNAPPPPHPLSDPGFELGRFRIKPRFPANIEIR